MPRNLTFGALGVLLALSPAPVMAQTHPATGMSTRPAVGTAPARNNVGRLQRTQDGWRSSQIVGANVYNDSNQVVGTIDNLLIGDDGKVKTAVLSVGGFLGIGSKLVSVPYDQLHFQDMNTNTGVVPAGAPAGPAGTGPATGAVGTTNVPMATAVAPGTTAAAPGAATAPGNTAAATNAMGGTAVGGTAPMVGTTARPGPTVTRIVLAGATKQSLTGMPAFHYGT